MIRTAIVFDICFVHVITNTRNKIVSLELKDFYNECDSIRINLPDGRPSHFSRYTSLISRPVCNILQIHYERRASGHKIYRVIHGQACSKCICAIFVECISVQSML